MSVVTTKVSAWGNSLGIRLPRSILTAADVQDNTTLDVRVKDGSLILTPLKTKKKTLKQLLHNVRPVNDPDIQAWVKTKSVGKEVW